MVEKIIVNPNEIRGYGNIHEATNISDWIIYRSRLTKTTDTVEGATEPVFQLQPTSYTLSFDSASYTTGDGTVLVTVTLMDGNFPVVGATVTITGGGGGTGIGTTSSSGMVTITVTGITESGTLTASYWGSTATASVTYQTTSYSLAFSQSTYTADEMDGVTVRCTLTDGGVAMSGETVTFIWEGVLGPLSSTGITNSNGVASRLLDYYDFASLPATVTATYQGVSATCQIVDGGF